MRAHEAGALHADGYRGPTWLQRPEDVNAITPALWATSVGRGSDGILTVGGVSVTDLAGRFGTPAYVIDAVSYTHLDVYKRQDLSIIRSLLDRSGRFPRPQEGISLG